MLERRLLAKLSLGRCARIKGLFLLKDYKYLMYCEDQSDDRVSWSSWKINNEQPTTGGKTCRLAKSWNSKGVSLQTMAMHPEMRPVHARLKVSRSKGTASLRLGAQKIRFREAERAKTLVHDFALTSRGVFLVLTETGEQQVNENRVLVDFVRLK